MGRGIYDRVEKELVARDRSPGLNMMELLTLPEPESGLLQWMTRQRAVTDGDVVAFLGGDEEQARLVLTGLLQKGWILELEVRGVIKYRVRLAPKRGRALPRNLWEALGDRVEGEEEK
jgi:hypothetical protein